MPVHRIGTAARLSGVTIEALRNWELRYGVVVPARGAGGHRLYSREDVECLRRIKALTDSGLSAREAHVLLAREREGAAARPMRGPEVRAETQRLRTLAADTT